MKPMRLEFPATTSQAAYVLRPSRLPAIDRGGGASTIPLATANRGASTYLSGITVFEPGASIAHHLHNTAESVMVISGRATVVIGEARTELDAFDTTFVPANVPHHFENLSDTEEMRILWVYGTPEATRTLISSGETRSVDEEATGAGDEGRSSEVLGAAVREVARIAVLPGHEHDFEAAVVEAVPLFQRARGARGLSLEASHEEPGTYVLTVLWERLEDHMHEFRESEAFQQWRALVGPHLAVPPQVEHLRHRLTGF